jgi:4-hydroxybutyrate dehydrogenase
MISSFSFPTPILHGVGALSELPRRLERLGSQRPLIVTDAGLLSTPAFGLLHAALGKNTAVFSGVHPNPVAADVEAAAEAWKEKDCDAVIGFGGGSALDVAKIVRAAVAHPDGQWKGLAPADDPGLLAPFVAVPTTAGTGSEVGRSSVITFGQNKRVIFHPALLAALVVLDPRVTAGLPPRLTAATGIDALAHCVESLTSPVFHPLCDAIALEGARIVFAHLPRAFADGSDLTARGMMQIAATMGGIAFQKDLGAVHSLSHPLSAHFGLNHGHANALCLVPVMRFNAAGAPGIYGRLSTALGLRDASDSAVIGEVASLLDQVGMRGGLREQGVPQEALDLLADAAFADPCHHTNPVQVTRDDLLSLYREAW